MKKLSKKGLVLLAGAVAVCASALPAMASAASWATVGSHHVLDSPNVGFTSTTAGPTVAQCTRSSFTTKVASAQSLTITAASFGGLCTASGANIGDCTMTWAPTRLPWIGTAVTTDDIQIHGVHIDVLFENTPTGNTCAISGTKLTITGTLTGGEWTGNSVNAFDFNNGEGLTADGALPEPITLRGFFKDTNGLTVN